MENFKSIRTAEVSITNLNVLMGANSVGKSSLIQSMVALAQLCAEQLPSDSVQLIGNAQDLGSASSISHRYPGNNLAQPVKIEVDLFETNNGQKLRYGIALEVGKENTNDFAVKTETLEYGEGAERQKHTFEAIRDSFDRPQGGRSVSIQFGEFEFKDIARVASNQKFPQVGDLEIDAWFGKFLRICFEHIDTKMRKELAATKGVSRSRLPNQFKPAQRIGVYVSKLMSGEAKDPTELDLKKMRKFESAFASNSPSTPDSRTRVSVKVDDDDLESYFRVLRSEKSESSTPSFTTLEWIGFDADTRIVRALRLIDKDRIISRISHSLLHLGPLRVVAPSQQQNRRSPSGLTPLGASGEFLAHTLMVRGMEKADYPFPDGSNTNSTLAQAANKWISFLGLDGQLKTDFVEGLTTRITLGNRMFSQLGSGVSQVLPVIALCLLGASSNGKLVIIEQPELHLHPNLQRKLADMFAIMSKAGVRLLIETHSEYLVTRLRLLLAKGEFDPALISLIFAEQSGKTRYDKHATVHQASLSETGDSDYWPEGFHSDSLRDRFELSALQMMRNED